MCKVIVSLTKNESGKWEIVKFQEGHSHDLPTPRKGQFLKFHRRVTAIHKSLHNAFSQAKVGTSKLMQVLNAQAKGYDGVGCDIRDMYNYKGYEGDK